jgi:excisionase family DNA binding protein
MNKPRRAATARQLALTVPQSTQISGLSERATWLLIHRGRFPYHRLGRKIIILRDELEAFLKNLPGIGVEEATERAAEVSDAR